MEALKYILNHCLLPVVFKVISQKPVAGIAHSVDGRAGTTERSSYKELHNPSCPEKFL